jgi:uncharacterized protein (DUF3084 family)
MTDKQPTIEDRLYQAKIVEESWGNIGEVKPAFNETEIQQILDGQKSLEELPKYVKALAETNALYENRKLEVSYLTEELPKLKKDIETLNNLNKNLIGFHENYKTAIEQENQKLKAEIEELKRNALLVDNEANKMYKEFQHLQQESKQAIEIVKRLEEEIDLRNYASSDCQIEIKEILQSILKGDKNDKTD